MFQRPLLESITGTLALVVAGVHLYWGIPRFVSYASVGTLADPRPLAFVLTGHVIVLAITLVALGAINSQTTYLPGIALMTVHLVSYAAWHTILSHGAPFATGTHGHEPESVGNAVLIVVEHVVNSPLALISKLSELAVLLLLVYLVINTTIDRTNYDSEGD